MRPCLVLVLSTPTGCAAASPDLPSIEGQLFDPRIQYLAIAGIFGDSPRVLDRDRLRQRVPRQPAPPPPPPVYQLQTHGPFDPAPPAPPPPPEPSVPSVTSYPSHLTTTFRSFGLAPSAYRRSM
jgi:hypothetical protein